jgi:hypothetical protein
MARLFKVLILLVILGSIAAVLAARKEESPATGPFAPPRGSFDTWPEVPVKPGA